MIHLNFININYFDDMIADMLSNKKLNPIVTELFIRSRKLNISIVFITRSYFAVPKNIRLNSTHYFIMKIPNKRELQQVAFNHSSDIDFSDLTILILKTYCKTIFIFCMDDLEFVANLCYVLLCFLL